MTSYTLTSGSGVLQDNGLAIPADPLNTDWQAYQAWLAAGNAPAPAPVPPVVVPAEVPMWAMQAALQQAGKYDSINQTVAAWATSSNAQQVAAYFAWTMGNYAGRGSAFIAAFAAQFGFAAADLDGLFNAANTIANASG